MALDSHWKVVYGDIIRELSGFQTKSLLKEFMSRENKRGELALFDTIAPADEAEFNLMSADTNFRADFETIGSPVFDDWLALQTPHMDVLQDKVLLSPYENLWAHWFRNIDEIAENANTESIKLKQGMKQIFKKQDTWLLDALSRATEQRGKDAASASPVAFPASQIINEDDGVFDLETISSIREKFETNYLGDERIYCTISPALKKSLIDSSNSTITSTDFVDSTSYFKDGTLPDIYGVHMIVHPLVSSFAGSFDDAAFAWCPQAIIYNQFDALQTQMDDVASQKFNTVLQVREYIGAARVDDLGVVQLTFGTA